MKLNQIHIQEGTMVKILELFPDVDDFLLFDSFQVAMESITLHRDQGRDGYPVNST